eukprot:29605-Pelagococcus_subviridis.AAC.5
MTDDFLPLTRSLAVAREGSTTNRARRAARASTLYLMSVCTTILYAYRVSYRFTSSLAACSRRRATRRERTGLFF